jgi:hypothetical protein
VALSQVADCFQTVIFEDNEIPQIVAVVFVYAQAPVLPVDEDLLVSAQRP